MLVKRHLLTAFNQAGRRRFSSKPASILAADMLGSFDVQSQSKVHAQLRRFTPENLLPLHPPNMYGGETLANALLAASRVLTPSKHQQPSSLTLEFLRPGAYNSPMEFSVTKMHESNRFMQASVFVKQNERAVALSSVSFHREEHGPDTLVYDAPFPEDVHSPDVLPFMDSWFEQEQKRDTQMPPASVVRMFLAKILGVQVKAIDPLTYFYLNKSPITKTRFWVRANPQDIEAAVPSLGEYWSAALLAYLSDFCLLGPAITQRPGFRLGKIVSLNHSMWFLANRTMSKPSEWILMDIKLVHSGNNVCLCELQMWSEDRKQLLAVCKQQGLVRPMSSKQKATGKVDA